MEGFLEILLAPSAALAAALGIAACLWRAAVLLRRWEAAAGIVYRTDFEEASQSWLRSGDDGVTVNELVRFADRAGTFHEVEMMRTVSRWQGPDAAHMIWYDPADPRRVTQWGPRHWLLLALGLSVALWLLLDPDTAMQLLTPPGHPT